MVSLCVGLGVGVCVCVSEEKYGWVGHGARREGFWWGRETSSMIHKCSSIILHCPHTIPSSRTHLQFATRNPCSLGSTSSGSWTWSRQSRTGWTASGRMGRWARGSWGSSCTETACQPGSRMHKHSWHRSSSSRQLRTSMRTSQSSHCSHWCCGTWWNAKSKLPDHQKLSSDLIHSRIKELKLQSMNNQVIGVLVSGRKVSIFIQHVWSTYE